MRNELSSFSGETSSVDAVSNPRNQQYERNISKMLNRVNLARKCLQNHFVDIITKVHHHHHVTNMVNHRLMEGMNVQLETRNAINAIKLDTLLENVRVCMILT